MDGDARVGEQVCDGRADLGAEDRQRPQFGRDERDVVHVRRPGGQELRQLAALVVEQSERRVARAHTARARSA
jgi:hypothetical protein